MAQFSYIALDNGGREQRGLIDASDEREVAQQLRAQSLFMVAVHEGQAVDLPGARQKSLRYFLSFFSPRRYLPPSINDRSLFLRQTALMLKSGYTIVQALDASSQLTDRLRFSRTIHRMSDAIRRGASFSSAIAAEKRTFTSLEAKLIASAEQGGDLAPVLERLSDDLTRRREVRRQFLVSMIYPTILIFFGSGVLYYLVTSVIPKFAHFLAGRGKALPPLTQFLLDISDWFIVYGPTLISWLAIIIFSLLVAYTTVIGKRKIDRVMLNIPVFGKTALFSGMAQAGWTMGMLLRSGVTLLEALRMTGSVMNNQTLADDFDRSADQILSGRSLASAFNQTVFPMLMQHMAAVGERSGALEQVMEESGDFYRKELRARIATLTEWMVPAGVLLIGLPVGIVYYAFFTALLAVSGGR